MTEIEWLTCEDPLRMLNWLTARPQQAAATRKRNKNHPSDRKLQLFACACCRRVWHLIVDARSRRAVEVAEQHADGEAMDRQLEAARQGAREAASEHRDGVAIICQKVAQGDDPGDIAWAIGHMTAGVTQMRQDGTGTSFRPCSHAVQSDLLREIIGNPFRPVTLLREDWRPELPAFARDGWVSGYPWLTTTVLSIAHRCYDDCDWDAMPILADALEEAGCQEEALLRHLRGWELCRDCMLPSPEEAEYGGGVYWCPGCGGTENGNVHAYWMPLRCGHVRGCWSLDLLLGKS
jgi:hypothetical protein